MSDKFLNTGGGAVNLSNGTATVFGATIGAINLDPSHAATKNKQRTTVGL